ncbi:MAG: hypothetical protein ACRDG8_04690 [Actinomycetota bacterium]
MPSFTLAGRGPFGGAGSAGICDRARDLVVDPDADLLVVDIGELTAPDVVAVDAMARVQLGARRLRRQVRFRHACPEILELVELLGLADVLRLDTASGIEPTWQAEQREQGGRVEEERDP